MSVGVKVFIVILAVLAVVFIGGFAGFGIYVVVQQQNETSFESSDNHNSSQFSNNSILDERHAEYIPDKTDRIFRVLHFHLQTVRCSHLNKYMKKYLYQWLVFYDLYRRYSRERFFGESGKWGHCNFQGYIITNAACN